MPSWPASSLAACNWLSAVHCTNSTNSTSRLSGPLRSSAHLASSGCCHSCGHSHHGPEKRCRSTSKQAKRDNSGARSARKASNSLRRASLALVTKAVEGGAQAEPFQRRHVGIGHTVAFAQLARRSLAPRRDEVGGQFRDRLDVDIERVEKQPAVRRIGLQSAGWSSNRTCSGLSPTPSAPSCLASRTRSARSVKSPMPQLRSERTL